MPGFTQYFTFCKTSTGHRIPCDDFKNIFVETVKQNCEKISLTKEMDDSLVSDEFIKVMTDELKKKGYDVLLDEMDVFKYQLIYHLIRHFS